MQHKLDFVAARGDTAARVSVVHEWLIAASERLAAEGGGEPADYALSQQEIDDLLELARVASHESGERINAPLVCYLVGLARARHGRDVADLVDAVVGKAP